MNISIAPIVSTSLYLRNCLENDGHEFAIHLSLPQIKSLCQFHRLTTSQNDQPTQLYFVGPTQHVSAHSINHQVYGDFIGHNGTNSIKVIYRLTFISWTTVKAKCCLPQTFQSAASHCSFLRLSISTFVVCSPNV
jgi:hypothetical protein